MAMAKTPETKKYLSVESKGKIARETESSGRNLGRASGQEGIIFGCILSLIMAEKE